MDQPAQMPSDERIGRALESIYALFAAPKPRVIEGCPCCLNTRQVDGAAGGPGDPGAAHSAGPLTGQRAARTLELQA